MKYLILNGDDRFTCLAELMRRRGDEVEHVVAAELRDGVPESRLNGVRRVVLNHPCGAREDAAAREALLDRLGADAVLLCCGPGAPEPGQYRRRVVNLWADEQLLIDNAALTAEGAVAAAMRTGTRSLRETPSLVLGWGRIGRALVELLVGMGVPVSVASRSEEHRYQALSRGAEAVDLMQLKAALPGKKLILNTAPHCVLNRDALACVDGDARIIDLASAPYGVDLNAAWQRGLRAWREPGLPGRACPVSAAGALLRAMDRAEKGGA